MWYFISVVIVGIVAMILFAIIIIRSGDDDIYCSGPNRGMKK